MELGAIDSREGLMDHEIAEVNTGGRINVPTRFDSMRELLTTLNDTLPNTAFSRKWLKSRSSREEGANGGYKTRFRGRGGKGGYQAQSGRNAGRQLRNREVEMEEWFAKEVEDIDVNSEVSEKVCHNIKSWK